jgi:hypothetical protein
MSTQTTQSCSLQTDKFKMQQRYIPLRPMYVRNIQHNVMYSYSAD